ncbi:MAG: 5'-3' exonuclease H3TH domain-containing protein, partial [Dehalococcoidia bacterium]
MAKKPQANTPDSPTLFDHAPAPESREPASQAKPSSPNHPRRLLLMDGHAMVFRAWFALAQQRPLTVRKTGEDVRGVYSFTTTFFKVLNDHKPTHIAIVFDPPGPTFRHEQFKAYKANRPEAPPEFHQNVERVKQVMRAFDIPIYETPGYEADDVLGTIAHQTTEQGIDTIIATGDTDTLQLISPHTQVLLTTGFSDTKLYDMAAFRERYDGLEPVQQRDVKALTGDTSDNIPGVPGIGVKTAVKLIKEFDSVEALLDRLDEVKPPRIQGLLRDHADSIRRGKHLVT